MTPAEIAAAIRAWPALADELEAMGMRVAAEAVRAFPSLAPDMIELRKWAVELLISNGQCDRIGKTADAVLAYVTKQD